MRLIKISWPKGCDNVSKDEDISPTSYEIIEHSLHKTEENSDELDIVLSERVCDKTGMVLSAENSDRFKPILERNEADIVIINTRQYHVKRNYQKYSETCTQINHPSFKLSPLMSNNFLSKKFKKKLKTEILSGFISAV